MPIILFVRSLVLTCSSPNRVFFFFFFFFLCVCVCVCVCGSPDVWFLLGYFSADLLHCLLNYRLFLCCIGYTCRGFLRFLFPSSGVHISLCVHEGPAATLAGALILFVFLSSLVCPSGAPTDVPLRVSVCPSFLFFHVALLSFSSFVFVRFASVLRVISFQFRLPMLSSSFSVLTLLRQFFLSDCLAFRFRCVPRLLICAFSVHFLLCSSSDAVSFCLAFP